MMHCTRLFTPAFGLTLAVTLSASAQQVTFELIDGALSANDMTPDGRFIVGETDLNGDGFPDGTYRYDRQTDEFLVLPAEGLGAVGVSDDGAVIIGDIIDPGTGSDVAAMWTAAENDWFSLGYLPDALSCPSRSNAYEVSADGSVVVGLSWDGCSGRGFVWTQATGMLELDALANGGNRASVVSADGTVIGGFAQGSFSRTPSVWNGTTTTGALLDPPTGDVVGEVYGMSDDGSTLLLAWDGDASTWTEADGVQTIGAGSLIPGWTGIPQDIADDGTIVGFEINLGQRRAWIKFPGDTEMQLLRQWIIAHGGDVPASLVIEVCQAISTDGRVMIGHGFGTGAWIVTVAPACPADLDTDGAVGFNDLVAVLAAWGTEGAGAAIAEPADVVDFSDLVALLAEWGPCGD